MEPVSALANPTPLSPAAARTLKKRTGRAGVGQSFLVLFIPHLWVGIGMITAAIWQITFPFVDRPVTGTVTELGSSYSSKNQRTTYSVTAAYEIDDLYDSVTYPVSQNEQAALHKGDSVPLRAAVIFGMTSARAKNATDAPVLVPFALFWNSIMGVFIYMLVILPVLQWWLLRRGVRVLGTVTNITRTTGKGASVIVAYEYTSDAGERCESNMKISPKDFDESVTLGGSVVVHHHPTHPRWSVLPAFCAYDIVADPNLAR
jgi:hypothetical protein